MVKVVRTTPAFEDNRGAIYDILEVPVGHVGMITSKKGAVRGNHYHKKSTQYTYLVSGSAEYLQRDTRGDSKLESVVLLPGDLVETPPLVIHAMRFLEDSTILDITTSSRESGGYENDTVRVQKPLTG